MSTNVIEVKEFNDVSELIDVLMSFQDARPNQVLHIKSEGFFVSGKAKLIEETLSDDSKVYNVELTNAD